MSSEAGMVLFSVIIVLFIFVYCWIIGIKVIYLHRISKILQNFFIKNKKMTLIKSISGIRGTIGSQPGNNLTPIDIVKFTTAYARFMSEKNEGKRLRIVVGRDARISGEMVNDIIEGTLLGCGVDVINVGLCTTPGTEMAVITYKADGGIIITASHNPKQWNALKLLNEKGEFLNDAEGKRVLALAEDDSYQFPDVDHLGTVISREDFNDTHIAQVLALPLVDVAAVRARKFKVVVDAVNSVGGVVMPKLLRELGCEVVELNCEPTGHFAHNPEPLPQNLTEISEVIVREGADLGIVVDPDVDRLAFVNEDGTMFVEEYTLVAVADYILSKQVGNTVSNLSSSRALRDVTEAHGGNYSASAVGEVNVVAMMKQTGAIIGGEGNGGVIYPELHYGRDALVGTALFLTYFAQKNMTMTALRASYPAYFASKNKIELTPAIDVDKVLLEMKARYASENVNDIDGVKIDFAESWVHLRKSNTEPIIRIYTEAKSPAEADALAERFIAEISEICNL
jgi:phosphomannomutase